MFGRIGIIFGRLSRLKVTKDKNSRSVTDSKEDVVYLYNEIRSDYLIHIHNHALCHMITSIKP